MYYVILEYIVVTIIMLACFMGYKAVAKKTISGESVRLLLKGSFVAFLIIMTYTLILSAIDNRFGSSGTSNILGLIVIIFNVTVYISITVFYYIMKTRGRIE